MNVLETKNTNLVWQFKESVGKNPGVVLTDITSYQALADLANVYMYERLPPAVTFNFEPVWGNENFFPQNSKDLKILSGKVDYLLMRLGSMSDLNSFLNVNQDFVVMWQDKKFIAFERNEKVK